MTWKAEPWLVLDLETTGVPAAEHHPIEIGFVRVVDGVETAAATYRVRPPIPIPEGASAVHGIRDEDVRDCPTLEDDILYLAFYNQRVCLHMQPDLTRLLANSRIKMSFLSQGRVSGLEINFSIG